MYNVYPVINIEELRFRTVEDMNPDFKKCYELRLLFFIQDSTSLPLHSTTPQI